MARLPYTNFHDLNLDWVIKQVKTAYTKDNPPPYPVKSVNGKTGVVTLYGTDILYSDMVGMTLREALDYLADWCVSLGDDIAGKISWPDLGGNPGDVLALDNDYNPIWIPPTQPVTDYDDLTDKPQINGHTLSGNKSGADLEVLDAPAVAGTAGEVLQSNGDNTQSWVNLNNKYAPIIKDTASGDPATFPDGLADMEMIVQAVINPVQDLHGYANPWPAGGGVNKLDLSSAIENTAYGFTITKNVSTGEVTISGIYDGGVANVSFVFLLNVPYMATARPIALDMNTDLQDHLLYPSTPIRWGNNTTGNIAVDLKDLVNGTLYTFTLKPMVCDNADTPTTYSPYSNICPITGHAGMTINRTGKNLFNKNETFADAGYYLNSSGVKVASANWSIAYIPVAVGETYSISGIVAGTTSAYLWWVDSNKNPVSAIGLHIIGGYQNITAPSNSKYIALSFISNAENASYDGNTLQVEFGPSATNYSAYIGDVYPLAWGDVAGTVYGGYYNNKTGKLTVTDAYIASYNGETLPSTWISDRDAYTPGIPPTTGAEVVYKLADPVEYTLYPVSINSFYADNNVFSDVGPVSVDYYADTKLFILKVI